MPRILHKWKILGIGNGGFGDVVVGQVELVLGMFPVKYVAVPRGIAAHKEFASGDQDEFGFEGVFKLDGFGEGGQLGNGHTQYVGELVQGGIVVGPKRDALIPAKQ